MPKGNKVITKNLNEFAEKIVSLLADESTSGRARVLGMLDQAKTQYERLIKSMVQGWVYQYSRLRVPEVDRVLATLSQTEPGITEVYTRLKTIKSLIKRGE
ncbi:MAG: hypothetical protein ACHP6H_02080, partial [Legionellales bacterium]